MTTLDRTVSAQAVHELETAMVARAVALEAENARLRALAMHAARLDLPLDVLQKRARAALARATQRTGD